MTEVPYFNIVKENEEIYLNSSSRKDSVVLNKLTLNIQLKPRKIDYKNKIKYYAILGKIDCRYNEYLILVSKVKCLGTIVDANIYQIQSIEFLSLSSNNNENDKEDDQYLIMIRHFLTYNNLYFSDQYNMQTSFHRFINSDQDYSQRPFKDKEDQFCWNINLVKKIPTLCEIAFFTFPVINGYVGIKNIKHLGKEIQLILISRKSHLKSGVKYFNRGIDENGNTANYVESEQIIVYKNEEKIYNICSYLQLRGSIPLFWSQYPDLSKSPKIRLQQSNESNAKALKQHIKLIKKDFKNITLVSLLNRKEEIEKRFELVIASTNDLKRQFNFVNFDSHDHTKPYLMNFKNLNNIFNLTEIQNSFSNYSFNHMKLNESFSFKKDRKIENLSFQNGVLRTNCLECLDRTNMIQFLFANKITSLIIKHLFNKESNISSTITDKFNKSFEDSLRILWTENGDQLSLSYTGGKSLFSEVIRNNKRSIIGILLDIKNGFRRYINNNFYDGYNQDSHDLFLCKLSPKRLIFEEHTKLGIIFCLLFIGITIISVKLYVLQEVENYTNLNFLIISLIYIICISISMKILQYFSQYIVDSPSLKGNTYY